MYRVRFYLCVGKYGIGRINGSEKVPSFCLAVRFPRLLAVIVIGAALAVTGAFMQALFENPLAEPGLLGVSNGAGVAVVLTVCCLQA